MPRANQFEALVRTADVAKHQKEHLPHKFLAQRIQGKYGGSTFAQPNDAQSDASSVRNNVYATPVGIRNPQSRKSVVEDDDIPNTDEFPQQ